MTKPKVIVHMSMSINGNITGPYGSVVDNEDLKYAYESKHESFNANAMLLGRKTIEEAFTEAEMPVLPENPEKYSRDEDFIADTPYNDYMISLDPSGKAAWSENHTSFRERPTMHVIEVLSESVSDAYLAHLRKLGISYIFGGKDRELDLELVLEKLNKHFGLDKIVVSGGGGINWSFFEQGLVDEVSVVVVPAVDDHYGRPNLFDNSKGESSVQPAGFKVQDVEQLDGNIIWLHYSK